MKTKTLITTASMLVMSIMGSYSPPAFTAPLDIDTSYGNNGTALAELYFGMYDEAHARHLGTGVLANNKVVTLSALNIQNTGRTEYNIARFDENGTLDPSFGVGGKLKLTNLAHHRAHEMAVQADGKITVVGRANANDSAAVDVFVARYLADGTNDTSFGNNGMVIIKNQPEFSAFILQVAVHSDGSIVVAAGSDDINMLRLTHSGQKASPFKIVKDLGGKEAVLDVDIDSNDRIVIVGDHINQNNDHQVFVARYTAAGVLDVNNFTPGNCLTCGYTLINAYDTHPNLLAQGFVHAHLLMDVAVNKPHGQPVYNKIVVSGSFGIIRLNEDGNPDTTFNGNGRVQNDWQFVDSSTPGSIYVGIRGDGQIISLNNRSATLTLYTENGNLATQCTGKTVVDLAMISSSVVVEEHALNFDVRIDSLNRAVVGGAYSPEGDPLNLAYPVHLFSLADRYQNHCKLILKPSPDPLDKMTLRDVHPFVHPQDIVGPEWKFGF